MDHGPIRRLEASAVAVSRQGHIVQGFSPETAGGRLFFSCWSFSRRTLLPVSGTRGVSACGTMRQCELRRFAIHSRYSSGKLS
jgi:hypothetical protein